MNASLPWRARFFELFVGVRYLGAVRRSQAVSFISLISVAGLILGVAALITVLSVMNGFDRELRARILGIVPHVLIDVAEVTQADLDRLRGVAGVSGAAPFAEAQGMVVAGARVLPVQLFGIAPDLEAAMSPLPGAMVSGRLEALGADGGLVLGASLAARLGVRVGDRVTLLLPRARGDVVQPTITAADVVGLFRLGAEPDQLLGFVDQRWLTQSSGVRSVPRLRVALDDVMDAPVLGPRLAARVQADPAAVSDWTRRYGQLFEAVGMEKTMMGLLLGLIVAIAVFNIVASLAMVVDEKRAAIAILLTLGATRRRILRIFVIQGALVGCAGVGIGVLLGVTLAWNIPAIMAGAEQLFGFELLAGTYFDRLPSHLQWSDVVVVGASALLLAVGAALYPAYRAGRIDPARGLQ